MDTSKAHWTCYICHKSPHNDSLPSLNAQEKSGKNNYICGRRI